MMPPILPLPPNRVWRTYKGGRTLDQLEGKPDPQDSHFAEDWIASTTRATNAGREHLAHEGLATVVVKGQPAFLRNLIAQHPAEMVGAAHFHAHGPDLGFLLKFLDSSVRLHVQAHPTVPFAKQHLHANYGKTEGYVILATRPEVREPYIYFGFQRPPEREAYRQAILEQDVDAILAPFDRVPVQPGDVFVVPGGIPHAIGEGVLMIEIMEPTDFAVRLEFERGGYVLPEASRFMGRGVDFALDMLSFEQLTPDDLRHCCFGHPRLHRDYGSAGLEWSLIDDRLTRCFGVRRLEVHGPLEKQEAGFYVAIVTAGAGEVAAGDMRLPVRYGDRLFVPAATDRVTFEADHMEVVLGLPPRAP